MNNTIVFKSSKEISHIGPEPTPMIILDEIDDENMTKENWDALTKIVNRRKELCDNAPMCSCGSKQVQLLSWIDIVKWRCRECKLIF